MPVNNVDPNAKKSKTVTTPYGGGNTNNPGANVNSPTIHELAVQTVNERGGVNASEQPNYKEQIKDVEAQMLDSINKTENFNGTNNNTKS